ncbi:steroid 21-hydroxylase [Pristis pectinata]|uniref:steroid 21-hydroxylase n=1 Tax=Pristis pectinata TaxID=685728 RepID=UPI00223E0BC0|nr:steroid 21-hydroxylase [Pristis pectinata]
MAVLTLLLFAIITLLLALGLCRNRRVQEDRSHRAVPGPSSLPLIGNLTDLRHKDLHVHLSELARTFGPIYRLRLWNQDIIVLNSLKLIKEALVKRSSEFAGRPRTFVGDYISFGGKDLSLGDYTHTWKIQKKMAHGAIQWSRISALEPVVLREAEKFCKVLQSYVGSPVDPNKDFSMFTCNTICSLIFSTNYDRNDQELQEIHDCLVELVYLWGSRAIGLVDMFPVLQYFHNSAWRQLQKAIHKRDSFVRHHIQKHKSKSVFQVTFQKGIIRDITDMLMKPIWDQEEGSSQRGEVTEEHVHMVIVDLFIGGTETTSSTLGWAVAYLVHRPEIQDRIFQELCSGVGEDRYPSYADRGKLPFLTATIVEVMRLRPVVPLSLPHRTTCNSSVAGYFVPSGTHIITNLFGANYDETKWTEPTQFRPERFLDMPDAEKTMQNVISFGMGARTCLGEPIARVELFLCLAYLLKEFKFLPAKTGELPELQSMEAKLMKVKPYRVTVVPRSKLQHN